MSVADPYPIHLRQVLFTRTCVIAIPGYEPPSEGVPSLAPENTLSVVRDPNNAHHFFATMRCIINKEAAATGPYSIDVECIAELDTDGSVLPDDEHRGVTINAHSVCYGAIRETVAWLTSRQPYGPVALGLSVLRTANPVAPHAQEDLPTGP